MTLKIARGPTAIRTLLLGMLLLAAPLYAVSADAKTMSFVDHLEVIREASEAEDWPTVDRHAAEAAHLATPEAFRSDYPDREFSADEVAVAARNRQGLLKTHAGWSAAGQGDRERALTLFTAADGLVRRSYLGLPSNDLYRYWGTTLIVDGQSEAGLEKLALVGLFARDEESFVAARTAYESVRHKKSWDDYVWELRRTHGARVEDFTALDYKDAVQSFDQLRGEKATLLTFWFPT